MPRRGTFRRARIPAATDVAKRPAPVDQLLDERADELPRAHVLRLLLHPAHFPDVRIRAQHRPQLLERERVELLDPDERDIRVRLALLTRHEIDVHLAAAQYDAPNPVALFA